LRLSPLPAVIAASVVLLFAALAGAFWRHGAALPGRVAWRNAALPFLVAAMTGAALLVPAIPIETRLHIAGVGWPSAVVAALVLVRRHAGARGAGAMIALAGLAFLVMAEAAVRHADYADTWTAHGVGEGFVTDETLFWAPRNLFITPNEISAPKSSIVNRVQFRSGATTDEIPPDTFRVVITGGSNVWGDGIENLEDTWGEKLESRLAERTGRPVEVVNAGVKGYNLFQLLVLHTMYLRDLRGDVLVLYLNYNDIMAAKERGPFTLRELWEARRGGRWDEIESYMRKTGLAPRTSWLGRVQDALHESRLYNGATRAIIAWRGKRVARVAEAAIRTINPVEDYVKNLEEMVALARERGMKVIFAPEFDSNVARFGTDAGFGSGENGARPETGPGFLEFRRAMEQTANRLGVPFCPTHASMAASRPDLDALVFPWDPVHLSPTGTTRLAEIMDECLVEKGMLGD
ncbi:hypothetical protein K8I61_06260, partial [bacterium]|nr:hypothetical protein [bacterium]